jgi:hypothetical protein
MTKVKFQPPIAFSKLPRSKLTAAAATGISRSKDEAVPKKQRFEDVGTENQRSHWVATHCALQNLV